MEYIPFHEVSPERWNEVYYKSQDPLGDLMETLFRSIPVEIDIDNLDVRELEADIYVRAKAAGYRPRFSQVDNSLYVKCFDQFDEPPF